jgi:hypothetical protein
MSDVLLLGYAGAAVLALCVLSGLVLTGQALFGEKTWAWLRRCTWFRLCLVLR